MMNVIPAGVVHADEQSLPRVLAQGTVLLDLHAPWCGPCKMMGPVLEAFERAHRGSITVVKVDVDANPRAARALGVQGVPTLMLFKDGRPLARTSGAMPLAGLEQWVQAAGGA